MEKTLLSERDICTKFITPAVVAAGWNLLTQIGEEYGSTRGRIIIRGRLAEQRRIVARVDESSALCDHLEAALATCESMQVRLLEAQLRRAHCD